MQENHPLLDILDSFIDVEKDEDYDYELLKRLIFMLPDIKDYFSEQEYNKLMDNCVKARKLYRDGCDEQDVDKAFYIWDQMDDVYIQIRKDFYKIILSRVQPIQS